MLSITCRDCKYGIIGINFGTVACIKRKIFSWNLLIAAQCPHYTSKSQKTYPLWREMLKGFRGKVLKRFYR